MHFAARIQALKCFSGMRIDPLQPALIAFPCPMPEIAVDPGNAGEETVGFDGTQDFARFEVHLLDARFGDLKGRLAIERGSRMRESRSR